MSVSRRSVLVGGVLGAAAALGTSLALLAEQPWYDDDGFEKVMLPHTVTGLSWDNWDYASWEGVWIYRKHFVGADVAGARVLVTFDGVMTDAVVMLNGWTAGAHAGGYLPWTTELTSRITEGDNV